MNVGMVHSVDIRRSVPTGADDAWGVPVETDTLVYAAVSALVQERTSREQPVPSGVEITDALIFLPWGTDIRPGDRIVHGAKTYLVIVMPTDAGGAGHHIEVSAARQVNLGG